MYEHSCLSRLEVSNCLVESIVRSWLWNISVLIQIDEVLHTLYRCIRCQIIKASTFTIDEASPWLLSTGSTTHTKSVYICLSITICIHCTFLNVLKELIVCLRCLCNTSLFEDWWSVVYIEYLNVPWHQIKWIVRSACLFHYVVDVVRNVIFLIPCINIRC